MEMKSNLSLQSVSLVGQSCWSGLLHCIYLESFKILCAIAIRCSSEHLSVLLMCSKLSWRPLNVRKSTFLTDHRRRLDSSLSVYDGMMNGHIMGGKAQLLHSYPTCTTCTTLYDFSAPVKTSLDIVRQLTSQRAAVHEDLGRPRSSSSRAYLSPSLTRVLPS